MHPALPSRPYGDRPDRRRPRPDRSRRALAGADRSGVSAGLGRRHDARHRSAGQKREDLGAAADLPAGQGRRQPRRAAKTVVAVKVLRRPRRAGRSGSSASSGTSWVKAGTAELNEQRSGRVRGRAPRSAEGRSLPRHRAEARRQARRQDPAGRLDAVGRPRLRRRVRRPQAGRGVDPPRARLQPGRPATLLQGLAQGRQGPPRRGPAERHGGQVQGRSSSARPSAPTARRSASSSTASTATSPPTAEETFRYGVAAARMKFQKAEGPARVVLAPARRLRPARRTPPRAAPRSTSSSGSVTRAATAG